MTGILSTLSLLAAILALAGCAADPQPYNCPALRGPRPPQSHHLVPSRPVATFSIVARDAKTGELGVAVQSHWFSVGSVVPWAEAGVGAVATQSFVDVRYGPMGLALMKGGRTSQEALTALTASDKGEAVRQVGIIDAEGRVATHTGSKCIRFASHQSGQAPDNSVYTAQANMMAKDGVPEAMGAMFERLDLPLAERLMACLEAAQKAGGDIRGRQSAAILIVKGQPTGRPWDDRAMELRVEDNPDPLKELARLIKLHRAYDRMNAGDLAVEKGDVPAAMREYNAARELAPESAEMVFWSAVSLANAGKVDDSLPLFAQAFKDSADWRELVRRLPDSGLLPKDPALIKRITDLP
jgi:uncharacterized Ntn-hydrolase superfamily protein